MGRPSGSGSGRRAPSADCKGAFPAWLAAPGARGLLACGSGPLAAPIAGGTNIAQCTVRRGPASAGYPLQSY
ncbi:hypothetical protein P171DRAFT_146598 [Karstenula rhodostoma CBS 690.94]|uniref:Uncharacterized protein n=1 Tax=Karstenula rhodostoma CBS 690.94 TaxID=1392251 RepID=A0A9P4PSY9_9PLEO|nr:hypothetical protein P171DRAFT_146598 [Karstenula rhodostoma CBS 690.94]